MDAVADGLAQAVPGDGAAVGELAEVDAAEDARLERQERLLAARVRALDVAGRRRGLGGVDAVDEDDAGIAARPRAGDQKIEDPPRVEPLHFLAGARVLERVCAAG